MNDINKDKEQQMANKFLKNVMITRKVASVELYITANAKMCLLSKAFPLAFAVQMLFIYVNVIR